MTYVETTLLGNEIKHKHRVYLLKTTLIVGNKSQWMGINTLYKSGFLVFVFDQEQNNSA